MKKYDETFKGWGYIMFKMREVRERDKKSLFYRAPEDARAIIIVADLLLLLCIIGYSYFSDGSLDYLLEILGYLTSWKIVTWIAIICTIIFMIIINKKILKAYTYEKEKEYLDFLMKTDKEE